MFEMSCDFEILRVAFTLIFVWKRKKLAKFFAPKVSAYLQLWLRKSKLLGGFFEFRLQPDTVLICQETI